MTELKNLIINLIEEGARKGETSEETAIQIIRAMKQMNRTEVKPKRGIGFVSQENLLRPS